MEKANHGNFKNGVMVRKTRKEDRGHLIMSLRNVRLMQLY